MPPIQTQTPMMPGNGMPQQPQGGAMLSMTEMGDDNKKKLSKQMIIMIACGACAFIFMILSLVLLMDRNKRVAEINALKKQITDGGSIVIDGETITPSTREKNPAISATYPSIYNFSYSSRSYEDESGASYTFTISIRDGKVFSCDANKTSADSASGTDMKKCQVSNLSGDIYKFVEIIDKDNSKNDLLGFIMTDGSVDFVQISKGLKNLNFEIVGKINPGGFVTDAFTVKQFTKDDITGDDVVIFVLADGSYAQYKKSMLHYN